MSGVLSINGVVLSKVDYSESSVITSIFSAECGLVKFIIKGDRRISKKHLPKVDLLRKLAISFNHKEDRELQMPSSIDSLGGFESIANNYHAYCCGLWICRFLDRNLHQFHPDPHLMDLFTNCLAILEKESEKDKQSLVVVGFILGFLDCEGLLPEGYFETGAPQLKPFFLHVCGEVAELPELTSQDLQNLNSWCSQTLNSFHLKHSELPQF